MFLDRLRDYFYRVIGKPRRSAPSSAGQENLEESEELGMLNKMSRLQRKQLLLAENQESSLRNLSNQLANLTSELHDLKKSMHHAHGSSIRMEEDEIMAILDDLRRIDAFLAEDSLSKKILFSLRQYFFDAANIVEIASPGVVYQGLDYDVVDTIADAAKEPGTIIEIVKQGYRRMDGSKIRNAHVVVSSLNETERQNT